MTPGPGVTGPGPGVMVYQPPPAPAIGASQIYFTGPDGMTVQWDITAPGRFDSQPLVLPARYNFPQGNVYRLKLANIPPAGDQAVPDPGSVQCLAADRGIPRPHGDSRRVDR